MAKQRKKSNPCFVLTLPLRCEPWQRDRLDELFRIINDMKNYLIAYERKQLKILTSQRAYCRLQRQLADAYKRKEQVDSVIEKLRKQCKQSKAKSQLKEQLANARRDEQEISSIIKQLGGQRMAILTAAGFSKYAKANQQVSLAL